MVLFHHYFGGEGFSHDCCWIIVLVRIIRRWGFRFSREVRLGLILCFNGLSHRMGWTVFIMIIIQIRILLFLGMINRIKMVLSLWNYGFDFNLDCQLLLFYDRISHDWNFYLHLVLIFEWGSTIWYYLFLILH